MIKRMEYAVSRGCNGVLFDFSDIVSNNPTPFAIKGNITKNNKIMTKIIIKRKKNHKF